MAISETIINKEGKILLFGLIDFLNNIAKGNNCFICGIRPEDAEFNNEHVIPNWILRRFNLHSETINLPNRSRTKYGNYTVPCCKNCNETLDKIYEKPISKLLSKSFNEVSMELGKSVELRNLLFKWLSLIYLKTHLKDKQFLKDRDKRKKSGTLAEIYFWEGMHHIHCIARSHYSGAKVHSNVYGTFIVLPIINPGQPASFDYVDSLLGKGVLLRLGEVGILSVMDDACAGYSILYEDLKKINGPLTSFQSRELLGHLNYININLKVRPEFYSRFSPELDYSIHAHVPPQVELLPIEERSTTVGEFLRLYVEEMIDPEIEEREKILEEIKLGRRTYLFDNDGNFINFNKHYP